MYKLSHQQKEPSFGLTFTIVSWLITRCEKYMVTDITWPENQQKMRRHTERERENVDEKILIFWLVDYTTVSSSACSYEHFECFLPIVVCFWEVFLCIDAHGWLIKTFFFMRPIQIINIVTICAGCFHQLRCLAIMHGIGRRLSTISHVKRVFMFRTLWLCYYLFICTLMWCFFFSRSFGVLLPFICSPWHRFCLSVTTGHSTPGRAVTTRKNAT